MTKKARVVILNGVGSVGKGSIAKALQTITVETFLHVQMDAFLDMLPEAAFDHPDGLIFETLEEDGKPSVAITTGPLCERVLRGMRRAIAAMAAEGNNLIVDEVMMGSQDPALGDYIALLANFEVFRVGVFAPLEVIEARERQRGDRMIGLARWQYSRVHAGMTYDLKIDASAATPLESAWKIKAAFGL